MKKFLLLPVFFLLFSCSPESKSQPHFQNIIWVDKALKFDTTYAPDRSVYSVYGAGTLVFFGSNQTIKSFSNTFINNNDSIAWGEPGVVIRKGHWKLTGSKVIADTRIVERTFLIPGYSADKATVDSYELRGDTLIQNGEIRFVPAKLLTKELDLVMRGRNGPSRPTAN